MQRHTKAFISRVVWGMAILLLGLPGSVLSCDICGCGAGNLYFGILPLSNRHFTALRYRTLDFHSHLNPGDPYEALVKTRETFQIMELMGRFQLASRWQILSFLPYVWGRQKTSSGNLYAQGIGDGTLLFQYRIWDTELLNPDRDWKYQLQVGAGTKAPLGNWESGIGKEGQVENPNFQPGTGSLDFITHFQFITRYKNSGLQSDLQLRRNGENPHGYRFGSRLTGNVNLFYQFQKKGFRSLIPYVGWSYDLSRKNTDRGYLIPETGGSLNQLSLGCQLFMRNIHFQGQYQTPVSQNLADQKIRSNQRWMFQMGLSF